ncbi:Thioredoxin-like protein CXXS1 [Acorus gramineus]|uniref:Thioredoxin-like protein CXXS1 n=1 Tax=Acorus gramineus TaxID=55184 RepID=A0AAV9AA70_ACOGR|nr:Thioredoxin-like protein CXXS1 [Acorus gramineus]
MKGQQQLHKSRVIKVESQESWDFLLAQASDQGCPVFIHFTASWCVPSIAMNSYVEELATTHEDIFFLLVDVDDIKAAATKMEVKAMPTFVLMKGGDVMEKLVGANPDAIKRWIDGFVQTFHSHNNQALH